MLGVTNLSITDFSSAYNSDKGDKLRVSLYYREVIVLEVVNGDKCHSFITFGSSLKGIIFYTEEQGHCILVDKWAVSSANHVCTGFVSGR